MRVNCPKAAACKKVGIVCCHRGEHDEKDGCLHDAGEGGCPNCEPVEEPADCKLSHIFMVERASLGGYDIWSVGFYASFDKAMSAVFHSMAENAITEGHYVKVKDSGAHIYLHEKFGAGFFSITKKRFGGVIECVS